MMQFDLGANQFTFTSERTTITYLTQVPGPVKPGEDMSGGKLDYQGPEGNLTFSGKDIALQSSPLGTLLTITLRIKDDTGGITFTLLIPRVVVNPDSALDFVTLGLKTSSRGFIIGEGPELTYSVLPLLAVARKVQVPA
jgi:hypothetical protein